VQLGTSIAFLQPMRKPIRIQNKLSGPFLLLTIATLITGCGSTSATTSSNLAGTSDTATSTSGLTISPSIISLTEGETYTFSASGGSGSGYSFAMGSGGSVAGSVTSAGYFISESSWTGTTYIILTDSAGNETYATVTISGSSSGTTSSSGGGTTTNSTVYNMTTTLTNCEGVTGGSGSRNNWQVNGTELRTINDSNNYTESPVYCIGLASAVPAGATVQGIQIGVFVINQSSGTDNSELQSLSLVYAGGLLGTPKSLNLLIPGNTATFPDFTEGGTSDSWGAGLTSTIVNDASFGVDIQTYRGNDRLFTGVTGSILPQVTIWYTLE
jgi:hypothetical protein